MNDLPVLSFAITDGKLQKEKTENVSHGDFFIISLAGTPY